MSRPVHFDRLPSRSHLIQEDWGFEFRKETSVSEEGVLIVGVGRRVSKPQRSEVWNWYPDSVSGTLNKGPGGKKGSGDCLTQNEGTGRTPCP